MKYLFIVNPKSGLKKNRQHFKDMIDAAFHNTKHTYGLVYTKGAGDATRLAQQAVSERYELVVAAGGDGTVNEVATALVDRSVILGILPLGSGNGLARSLAVPLKLEAALDTLLNPKIIAMDVGVVNDRLFIGVCGVGFDANIGKKYQDYGTRGTFPYFIIGIKEYFQFRPETYTIESDCPTLIISPLLITVANTRQYGGGAVIAPKADYQDGWLDVCILEHTAWLKAACILPLLFMGKIDKSKFYRHFRCRALKISCQNDDGYMHTDGEPWLREKILDIQIKPSALQVCVSRQHGGDRRQETGDRDEICL
jgi:diacylglycerol kinase (ATP)